MRGSASADLSHGDLVAGWVHARSVARGVALPVADHGGWRVDTNSDAEIRRYIFAEAGPEIASLARKMTQSRIWVKACCEDAVLASCLPTAWTLSTPAWMMVGPGSTGDADAALPTGYHATVERVGVCATVEIRAADGSLAASGHSAEASGVFVYDRIVVAPAHRRRGLGRSIMHSLSSQRKSLESQPVLVATEAGRALYETIGWEVYRPYASAVIPDQAV